MIVSKLEEDEEENEREADKGKGFGRGHPWCVHCGCPSRPAVLMFNDTSCIRDGLLREIYEHWRYTTFASLFGESKQKLLILEVGAGKTVPTARYHSERYFRELKEMVETKGDPEEAAGNPLDPEEEWACKLIRINPDYPHADKPENVANVISIQMKAIDALKHIDSFL
jgi:hypothetical protein